MTPPPSVRPFAAEEWRTYRDLRLRALAESPGAFGSTYAESVRRADDEWVDRLTRGTGSPEELPLVAMRGAEPIGLAWCRVDDDDPLLAHVYQMWVDPRHRRCGAGRLLLATIVHWARSRQARQLELGVTTANLPARRLYESAGFVARGDPVPLRPGSGILCQSMRLDLGATDP
jgi:ribosomal protein S18 acetylase RimI-like enzyme